MLNLNKISKLILATVFFCFATSLAADHAWAIESFSLTSYQNDLSILKTSQYKELIQKKPCSNHLECPDGYMCYQPAGPQWTGTCMDSSTYNFREIAINAKNEDKGVTGCNTDWGLFSGLITNGRKIFNGLRDLIYVVAGFGIIGVSVSGFFGNINWKWLGAIVIGLVVIATTGELIDAITGCENFSAKLIADTLK